MKSHVKVTPSVALRILEFQNYRCALTGRELTPETAVLDHINPISRGGEHSARNIWVLHKDVNMAKGKLLLDEFYELCRLVLEHKDMAVVLKQQADAGWISSMETLALLEVSK